MSGEGIELRARAAEEGLQELLAPSVGVFTPCVASGQLVSGGQNVGTLEVLGVRRELTVPSGVAGRISARVGGGRARVPVQFGDVLIAVSSDALSESAGEAQTGPAGIGGALSFDAPMSGRFYSRPSPTEPAFVVVGDSVKRGQTIGLLEVMKTFNRLVYQGDTVPAEAVVQRIVPDDGADVVRGDPVLLLASPEKG